jgi:thioredoxin-related protein
MFGKWCAGAVCLSFIVAFGAIQSYSVSGEPQIVWFRDLHKAHKVSVETKRPILLVFGSESCLYCERLERLTLADAKVRHLIQTAFVPVRLDLGRDERIAKILEVDAVPCTIVLTPEADLVGKFSGFVAPDRYQQRLLEAKRLQEELQQVRQAAHAGPPAGGRS